MSTRRPIHRPRILSATTAVILAVVASVCGAQPSTSRTVLGIDGKTDYRSESQVMAGLVNAKQPGDRIEFAVLRGGKPTKFGFPAQ